MMLPNFTSWCWPSRFTTHMADQPGNVHSVISVQRLEFSMVPRSRSFNCNRHGPCSACTVCPHPSAPRGRGTRNGVAAF